MNTIIFCIGLILKMQKERQERLEKEEEERKEKERQEAEEMVRKIHEDPDSLSEQPTASSEQTEDMASKDNAERSQKADKSAGGEQGSSESIKNGNKITIESEDMEVEEVTEGVDKDGNVL